MPHQSSSEVASGGCRSGGVLPMLLMMMTIGTVFEIDVVVP
jgi:hypothetical protein